MNVDVDVGCGICTVTDDWHYKQYHDIFIYAAISFWFHTVPKIRLFSSSIPIICIYWWTLNYILLVQIAFGHFVIYRTKFSRGKYCENIETRNTSLYNEQISKNYFPLSLKLLSLSVCIFLCGFWLVCAELT